ncbi:MAG TPA: glutamine synthetase III [Candidatus Acidoferrum sp.]|nr:glutamine synthetase III [Candidatus Acidoferrum sp.]
MTNPALENYGKNLFNDEEMRKRVPPAAYKAWRQTIDEGVPLDPAAADDIAEAMKEWAVAHGATHYTHWFQPLTGATAEKHDSFLESDGVDGIIMHLSGKSLIRGEPDASSFPSGGLRATFEARGYTAWDCTSPAFVKQEGGGVTLYIPTAYCSYHGEALDLKTPLLRSMEALNTHALRILRLFGDTESKRVIPNVGAEQEYFLVDKEMADARTDLKLTGKTLMGAHPIKGQEDERHYYGSITERVAAFMNELDLELWKVGIITKTKHNEAAPCQHEMAPLYRSANIACDQNQIVMDMMKRVAERQGLSCLLAEKPFTGINGSGKHNNWSLGTDTGHNLLEPGKTPYDNAQFLIFLSAVIRAVDKHALLLRLACASASNDRRLGGFEAPPAVISVFLGDELMAMIDKVRSNLEQPERVRTLKFGVPALPEVYRDNTDRNRTSPFAFTGNKFEFRMVGSSQSLSESCTVLNTIVAESLDDIASRLEMAVDFEAEVRDIFRDILFGHDKILFSGNGYSGEWTRLAEERGLPIIKNTLDAIPALKKRQTYDLYERYGVFTHPELDARREILYEQYAEHVSLEARVMADMAMRQIVPAMTEYAGSLAKDIALLKQAGIETPQSAMLVNIGKKIADVVTAAGALSQALAGAHGYAVKEEEATYLRDSVLPLMYQLGYACDALEVLAPRGVWPMPTYDDLLFYN